MRQLPRRRRAAAASGRPLPTARCSLTFPDPADHIAWVDDGLGRRRRGQPLRRPGPARRPAHRRRDGRRACRPSARPSPRRRSSPSSATSGRSSAARPIRPGPSEGEGGAGGEAQSEEGDTGGGSRPAVAAARRPRRRRRPAGAATAYWLAEAGHDVRRRRAEDVPPGEDLRRRAHAPGGQAARRHGPRGPARQPPPLRRPADRRPRHHPRAGVARAPASPSYGYVVRRRDLDELVAEHASRRGPTCAQGHRGGRARPRAGPGRGAPSSRPQGRRGARGGAGPLRGGGRRRQLPLRAGARAPPATAATRRAWPSGATTRARGTTSRGSSRPSTCATGTAASLPGYGWIFPVGDGTVNVGIGLLSTFSDWKEVNTIAPDGRVRGHRARPTGASRPRVEAERPTGGRLPMAGSVGPQGRARPGSWSATPPAPINPFNGEGIDYAYETGRMAADGLDEALRTGDGLALQRYPAPPRGRVRPLLQGGPRCSSRSSAARR